MDVFPAFIPLSGKIVVVAGSGDAAEAKARLFNGSSARLICLSEAQGVMEGAYSGVTLAFIAGNAAFTEAAAAAARRAGALVNVVDRPHLSDFYTPAIVDRGTVLGAIGTGGAAPVLATQLRNALEAQWPEGLGRLADLLRELQTEVRLRFPSSGERRTFLRDLATGPAAQAALAGDLERSLEIGRAALAAPSSRIGVLSIMDQPHAPDLLSLRALRNLGRADRIVFDPSRTPEVLTFARRDALRTDESTATDAALAAWLGSGEDVVWLTGNETEAQSVMERANKLGVNFASL